MHGYSSGNVLTPVPDARRKDQEEKIGGSYWEVYKKVIVPYVSQDSIVLEIGAGGGSWTKALLARAKKVHAVDIVNVGQWVQHEKLRVHVIENNDYSQFQDEYFDFCFSWGVLCHLSHEEISQVLENTLPKMKKGALAVHHYSNTKKLKRLGRDGKVGNWKDNDEEIMSTLIGEGWQILSLDLGLVQRDSVMMLRKA